MHIDRTVKNLNKRDVFCYFACRLCFAAFACLFACLLNKFIWLPKSNTDDFRWLATITHGN